MKFIVLLLATIALVIGFANAANIRASTGSEETQTLLQIYSKI